jgi:hypothetical protein
MSEFVNKILAELKNNSSVKGESLVKMVVESIEKSISLGESKEKIYIDLKTSLVSINEKVKNPTLGIILSQFKKNETTTNSLIEAIANEFSLKKEISLLKESTAYSNPLIRTQVDQFEQHLNLGYPSFSLCENYISSFNNHSYESTISKSITRVKKYLAENDAKVRVLWSIFEMDNTPTSMYTSVSNEIKEMLVSESYSADILKIKFGNSIPLVTSLINDLRILESKKFGTFTIGEGNGDTQVNNLISPAIKTADGIILYTDNRFLSIREAKDLTGKEVKVHINEDFKISDLSPEYVKSTYGKFYDLCEAYATLGFERSSNGLSLDATLTKGVNLSFKLNEKKNIDFYLNGTICTSASSIHESMVFESSTTKTKINSLFENLSSIFHLEFIKEITNDRTLSEALVLNLNESYYVCDKVNAADREWSKLNESQLTQFFSSKFNYDVTSIFKIKLDESARTLRIIEEKKKSILSDIEKLEQTSQKLDETINSNVVDHADVQKLTSIKESIISAISNLKKEYEEVDLFKKKVA